MTQEEDDEKIDNFIVIGFCICVVIALATGVLWLMRWWPFS